MEESSSIDPPHLEPSSIDAKESVQKPSSSRLSLPLMIIGLLVMGIDQITKGMVVFYLPKTHAFYAQYPYGGIGVFENFLGVEFSLNYVGNKGAAWGLLGNHADLLILLRILLILGLFIYLFFYNSHKNWQLPLMLIIAGATANVIDFFVYGHVVDMLHFVLWGYDFPVFNVADSAISIGIGSCLLLSFFKDH